MKDTRCKEIKVLLKSSYNDKRSKMCILLVLSLFDLLNGGLVFRVTSNEVTPTFPVRVFVLFNSNSYQKHLSKNI